MVYFKREDYKYPVTDEDIEFDNLCEEYKEKFGEEYGVLFDDNRPLSEHIRILKEAIRSGKPIERVEHHVPDWIIL